MCSNGYKTRLSKKVFYFFLFSCLSVCLPFESINCLQFLLFLVVLPLTLKKGNRLRADTDSNNNKAKQIMYTCNVHSRRGDAVDKKKLVKSKSLCISKNMAWKIGKGKMFWSLCFITKLIMKSFHKIISRTSNSRKKNKKGKWYKNMKEKVYNSFFLSRLMLFFLYKYVNINAHVTRKNFMQCSLLFVVCERVKYLPICMKILLLD